MNVTEAIAVVDRKEQIRRVLRNSAQPISVKDEDSWLMRLWKCCLTVAKDENDSYLLLHEAMTYVAERNPDGYVGPEFINKALGQ